MIAEAKPSVSPDLKSPGAVDVPVTVVVIAAEQPTDQPTFVFQGLDTKNSVWIYSDEADFTLTLSPTGFPAGYSVTFATTGPGPITWLTPGSGQPIKRPDYISEPLLSDDSTVLTFNDVNTANPNRDVLVSFAVNVEIVPPRQDASDAEPFTSQGHPYSSPDPTIINVDPPPNGTN